MRLTNYLFVLTLLSVMAAISCEPFLPEFPEESVEAYRPIYADDESVMISKESGRDIKTAGKIFVYSDVLLINELNEGIHVYDNTDPTKPENLFFIAIPGNTDMSMSNGLLYANNMSDLVTINITLSNFEVTQRFEGLFLDEKNLNYPPGNDVYFECIEESKGRLIGWKKDIIYAPKCYKR